MSHASPLYNVTRRVGGAIGVAALAGVLAALAGPGCRAPVGVSRSVRRGRSDERRRGGLGGARAGDAKEHAGAAEAEMAVG